MLLSTGLSLFIFFLMIRRPPRSTLFPTRRSSDLHRIVADLMYAENFFIVLYDSQRDTIRFAYFADVADPRSEEHTSELQSRRDLVCRLLLEKKNNLNSFMHCDGAATTDSCLTRQH